MADKSVFAFLGDQILTKKGHKKDVAELTDVNVLDTTPVVLVYFSAHWCPPCRQFTPILKKWYKDVNAVTKKVEIVFVSLDQDQAKFDEYYGSMNFAAAKYDKSKIATIQAKIPFTGIPLLVVLNKDGSVRNNEARNDVMTNGPDCVNAWL